MSALVAAGFHLVVAVIRLLVIHLTSLFSSCRFCSEYSTISHWRGRLALVVVAMLRIITIEVAEALPCPTKVLMPKAQNPKPQTVNPK